MLDMSESELTEVQVLDALEISRATFRKIQQNLWWAFGYNLVGIPVAAGVLLPAYGLALTPSLSGTHEPTHVQLF